MKRPAALLGLLIMAPLARAGECLEVLEPSSLVSGGSYRCIVIADTATGAVLDRVTVQDSPREGIRVYADDVTLRNVTVTGSASHGVLVGCSSWEADGTCPHVPKRTRIEGGRFESNAICGVQVDICIGCVLSRVTSRYNTSNGILVGEAASLYEISDSEISYNGTYGLSHGLYINGLSAKILRNKVHHNTGYGIHAWPDPFGTDAQPFLIQQNHVYRNGKGAIVVGGRGSHVSLWLNQER
jgi:hypothetical protein